VLPAGIFLPNILGLVIEGDVLVTDDTTSQKYALEANYTEAKLYLSPERLLKQFRLQRFFRGFG